MATFDSAFARGLLSNCLAGLCFAATFNGFPTRPRAECFSQINLPDAQIRDKDMPVHLLRRKALAVGLLLLIHKE